jgi:hypothetical protein
MTRANQPLRVRKVPAPLPTGQRETEEECQRRVKRLKQEANRTLAPELQWFFEEQFSRRD